MGSFRSMLVVTLTTLHGFHRFKVVERLDEVVEQCLEILQDADEHPGSFKSHDGTPD